MKIVFGFFVLSVLGSYTSFCQSANQRYEKIRALLINADSVVVLSHEDTNGFFEKDDGTLYSAPQLVVNGSINQSIVHERIVLRKDQVTRLIKIITKSAHNHPKQGAGCFEPHHSLFIAADGGYLLLEICFQCIGMRASEGIDFSGYDMSESKWKSLKKFFREIGITYKL